MGGAGLALFAALIVLVPACLAASCDSISSCEDCHALDHCSWCVVDGAGLCFPAEWDVCKGEERSCQKMLVQRQQVEQEDPAVCNFVLCSGARNVNDFLTNNPSPCQTIDGGVACKACLDGSTPDAWSCYGPDTVAPYDGLTCNAGYILDNTTLSNIFSERCYPLIAAAPQVELITEASQVINVQGGPEFFDFIETTLAGPAWTALPNGTMVLDLDALSATDYSTLVSFVVGLCNQAALAGITADNVIIIAVTVVPQPGKRGTLDNDLIQVQFALLKNDDPAATDAIVQQVATGLQQGNIPGFDPLSVGVTPSTEVVFNNTAGNNSTTVPPKTDQVKARDPTSPLNGGAIFGIIFGSALFVVCVAAGVAYLFYRYRSSHRPPFDPARAT